MGDRRGTGWLGVAVPGRLRPQRGTRPGRRRPAGRPGRDQTGLDVDAAIVERGHAGHRVRSGGGRLALAAVGSADADHTRTGRCRELGRPSRPTARPDAGYASTDADDREPATPALLLGLGAVALTGLIAELARRRRLQQRARRSGDRIPTPQPAAAAAEATARAGTAPLTIDRLGGALRSLAAGCAQRGRPLPDVLLIRVSPPAIELVLTEDDAEPVEPFTAGGARRWRLDGSPESHPDGQDPYPALVTRVADAMRALAVDLAVRQAEREITVRVDSTRELISGGGAADVRRARSRQAEIDATVPEVVIAAGPLTEHPAPWCGVVLVASGEAAPDGWRLTIGESGRARLEPLGLALDPQTLTRTDYDHVVSLLATATQAAEPGVANSENNRVASEAVLAALPDEPAPHVDPHDDAAAPRVLVLGNVRVERAHDDAVPHRRRRATELAAYLVLHPGATAYEIDEAMWPGRRVDKTTRSPFVSRTRQWLGRTSDGEPYLPQVADGSTYRLRPEVSCDWHEFVRLARHGLADPPGRGDDLAAALGLVRGRPFLGIDPTTYTWAETDTQEMISAIVDVAHVLSAARLEAGDHRGAQEAAAKGLLAEPCSELLYRDAIRAAAARGDHYEVERLADRLRHELALLDPEDGLDPETVELIRAPTSRQPVTRSPSAPQ